MLQRLRHGDAQHQGGRETKSFRHWNLSDLAPYFGTELYSSYDMGSFDRDLGFCMLLGRSGFVPHRCVVVEGSSVGIQAAIAAGVAELPHSPSSSEHSDGADVTLANTAELTKRTSHL